MTSGAVNRVIGMWAVVLGAWWAIPLHAQPAEEARRFHLAQGYESSGDNVNASRVYMELYQRDRQSNVYFEAVRRTYIALARFDELLPIVEERVNRFPSDVVLRTQYADLLYRTEHADRAEKEWRAALDLRPDDPLTYQIVAQSQVDNRQYERAVETFKTGRQRLADPTAFMDVLAPIYGALQRYADAAEEYLLMLDVDPTRLGYVMGGFSRFTTNTDGADAAIAAVRARLKTRAGDPRYLKLLAWLYGERGDDAGALDVVKQLDDARKGHGSDVYEYADRAIQEGRFAAAIPALEYFTGHYPHDNPLYGMAVLAYARALELRYRAMPSRSRKDAEELAERYGTIARENPVMAVAPQSLLRRARLEADDLDDPAAALKTIEALRRDYGAYPDMEEVRLLEADLRLRTGDVELAQRLYTEGAARAGDSEEGRKYRNLNLLRSAEIYFFNGAFKDAASAFATLADDPGTDVANDALSYQFLLQENMENNADALKRYAAGMLLLRQHRWKEAIDGLQTVAKSNPDGALADESLVAEAEAMEMLGRNADAVATLLGVVARYSTGNLADRALYHAAEITDRKLGDRVKGMELYMRLLAEYPKSQFAVQARARVRALRGGS
ncbi:MAG: tetratricopeptide repeat protein [Bacteroidetes bacterium]|nr:tetratricopeptide repeat protein [Bacteroidota bacterium]